MNLVLIGYRGTGKTTLAGLLARRLGFEALSTDPPRRGARRKLDPADRGATRLGAVPELESEVIAALAGRDRLVVDTAGGLYCAPGT